MKQQIIGLEICWKLSDEKYCKIITGKDPEMWLAKGQMMTLINFLYDLINQSWMQLIFENILSATSLSEK